MKIDTLFVINNLEGYKVRAKEFALFGLEFYGLHQLECTDFEKISNCETWVSYKYENDTDEFDVGLIFDSSDDSVRVSSVKLLRVNL